MLHPKLAIFAINIEWVNLRVVRAWHLFHEHPYCNDSDILSFLFLKVTYV